MQVENQCIGPIYISIYVRTFTRQQNLTNTIESKSIYNKPKLPFQSHLLPYEHLGRLLAVLKTEIHRRVCPPPLLRTLQDKNNVERIVYCVY